MLWSLVLFPSFAVYAFAFSWASLFGGSVAADQYVIKGDDPEPPQPTALRIAVIGAGAAGSSAAFWINKAAERLDEDVVVDIYERSDYVGGRSITVYPYNDTSLKPAELGASIFVDANKNLVRATKEFNLEVKSFEEGEDLGIWDGSQFVVTMGASTFFGKIWENIKLLWRYGYNSPSKTTALVKSMIDSFVTLYTTNLRWNSVEEISSKLNYTSYTSQDAATFLSGQGVNDLFAFEVVEASTRVNYAQDLDRIHALEGMVSMAANGAKGVKEGNFRIFENWVKASNANLRLGTKVTSLQRKPNGKWILTSQQGDGTGFGYGSKSNAVKTEQYDSVIIAAPFDTLEIELPSDIAQVKPAPYIHLHVTLLTTKTSSLNPTYFGLREGDAIPAMILTTAQAKRNGAVEPEFNSLSYHGRVTDDEGHPKWDEWVVKLFSMQRLEDEWLEKVFRNVGWVHRKEWNSYPVLPPTSEYNPMKLASGLYYVNGFETFISTMETETIASRGIVDLLFREKFGDERGLCPQGYVSTPPEGLDFVWGWDC